MYKEYISNYNTAMSTVRKCKASNEQFNNIFSKVCFIVAHVAHVAQTLRTINRCCLFYVSANQELRVQSIQEVTTLEGMFY